MNLVTDYRDDENVCCLVRRMDAFPLLPLNLIDSTLHQIHQLAPTNNPKYGRLIQYFKFQWAHPICPRIDRSYWSHYDNDGARTNNHLEGKKFF